MIKYRVKPVDIMHDIWMLQERTFFIFWKFIGLGRKDEVTKKCKELNEQSNG